MLRPYTDGAPNPVDREYPVHMVGHHHEFLHRCTCKMVGDLDPTRSNDFSKRTQSNSVILNFAENIPVSRGANRNEIRPWFRIVHSSQSDRPAMKFLLFRHASLLARICPSCPARGTRRGTIHRALSCNADGVLARKPRHSCPVPCHERGRRVQTDGRYILDKL